MEAQYNARNPAVKRLFREAQELSQNPDEDFHAAPLEDNLFEWHFTIRGPADTPFENGLYHGRIILPAEYPMKPPNIIILTPNGRFETNTKICLSISGYHPETWQPSWSIRTALKALIGFMPSPASGAIGSLELPEARRRELAVTSRNWACPECNKQNHVIFTVNAAAGSALVVNADAAGDQKDNTLPSITVDATSGLNSDQEPRKSPESASGGGDFEDVAVSTSQPIRPRTSSLQSKPGRGVGKRAHFEDERLSPSASPSAPTSAPYAFPPPSLATTTTNSRTPESPSPLMTPSPTPATEGATLSAEDMRSRQAAILTERRRQLQDRLAATTTPVPPPMAAALDPVGGVALASVDLARLERAVATLRQVVVLIFFCIAFLVLRRIIMGH